MSLIDKLVADLAPSGVDTRPLGDVGEFVRGNGLPKSALTEDGFPAIHYGQIHTHYGTSAESTKSFTDPALAAKLRRAQPGDLIIATTSEDDEAVAKATAWKGDGEVAVSGDAYIYRHTLDPVYVAYFFQSRAFRNQKQRYITGTKVRRVSGDSLSKIRIPVPPVEVQKEIVRVLDEYFSLTEKLAQNLLREQQERRRQYGFLVGEIIAGIDAQHETLRDLGAWRGGITPSKSEPRYWESGTIPWLASMDVSESEAKEIRGRVTPAALAETSLRVFAPPSVVVVMRSNILRNRLPIGLTTVETAINQDLKVLLPRDDVDPEYVFQVLRGSSERIRTACVRTDGSMAALDTKAFLDWSLPVPSIREQMRIAARLRDLDAAADELQQSLSAELSARNQQYAHYRDRLLTFAEAAA